MNFSLMTFFLTMTLWFLSCSVIVAILAIVTINPVTRHKDQRHACIILTLLFAVLYLGATYFGI